MLLPNFKVPPFHGGLLHRSRRTRIAVPPLLSAPAIVRARPSSSLSPPSSRYAVLGAGFAGLSVAWHLLTHSPKEMHLHIDIYDEAGIGGGASGVSGGLLHPYSPKAKLLWQGHDCWKECLKLLSVAEAAVGLNASNGEVEDSSQNLDEFIVRRRGILRPATSMKNLDILNDVIPFVPSQPEYSNATAMKHDTCPNETYQYWNAQNCLASCRIETMDTDAAQKLIPDLHVPFNSAFYMPEAVNINPQRYLQALFLACDNLVKELSTSGFGVKELCLHKKSVLELLQLEGDYDAVIICLGAKADMLPELSGKLPLRTCRGVVAHLQLPDHIGEEYPDHGPSILSDAWLAVQGPRNLYMGSTWDWKSRNSSPNVSEEEVSKALGELLPKASTIFPTIKDWTFSGARAGLRAMPPLTPNGSLPLLGCIDGILGKKLDCKYWLFGGLGSRGLLYHGWLGKLLALAVLSCNEDSIPPELTSWNR